MSMRKLYLTLFLLFNLTLGQSFGNPVNNPFYNPKPRNVGYRFYLKTDILNTALRYFFVKPTYDVDIQGTLRLNNDVHLVASYGETTFYLEQKVASTERENIALNVVRAGKAKHRTNVTLRYYPFDKGEYKDADFFFLEGGLHFQYYKGTTDYKVFDSSIGSYETDYLHTIEMLRFGPQVNIGLSRYFNNFARWRPDWIFAPEILVGLAYNGVCVLKDKYDVQAGEAPYEAYKEDKLRLNLRVRFGIGWKK